MLGGQIFQRVRPGEMPLAPTNAERLADWASRYYLITGPMHRPFPATRSDTARPGFSPPRSHSDKPGQLPARRTEPSAGPDVAAGSHYGGNASSGLRKRGRPGAGYAPMRSG
jgi:hypothetical protein